MAFTVELTIRGLIALVPNEPIDYNLLGPPGEPGKPGQPQHISGMTVLVINARNPEVVPNGEDPPKSLEVCGHLPLLRYPLPEGTLSDFLLLDGHRIGISDVEPRGLEIDPSFREWIPMDFAVSGRTLGQNPVRIDPRFLAPTLPIEIAGRLDLEAGTVKAEKSVGIWDFIPPFANQSTNPADNRFKFASEVEVSILINGDQAVLSAVDRTGKPIAPKVLRPRQGSRSVKLLLSNLCVEGAEDNERPRVEGDFAVFYRLLANYNGVLRVPRLLGGPNGGQGTVQGGANTSPACTGAGMNR